MPNSPRKEEILLSPSKINKILVLVESIQKSTKILSDYCSIHDSTEEIYYLSPLVNLLKEDSEKLENLLDNLFIFDN